MFLQSQCWGRHQPKGTFHEVLARTRRLMPDRFDSVSRGVVSLAVSNNRLLDAAFRDIVGSSFAGIQIVSKSRTRPYLCICL